VGLGCSQLVHRRVTHDKNTAFGLYAQNDPTILTAILIYNVTFTKFSKKSNFWLKIILYFSDDSLSQVCMLCIINEGGRQGSHRRSNEEPVIDDQNIWKLYKVTVSKLA
jgi:hypothetical protein